MKINKKQLITKKMGFFNITKTNTWLQISWKGVNLDAKIHVPKYRSATMEQPEEGGINDFELISLEYKGESVKSMFENSDEIDVINELIVERYEKDNL